MTSASIDFSAVIEEVLREDHGMDTAETLVKTSPIIGYLLKKTRAANSGSKSRGSFANLYAIYVLAEDYVAKGFLTAGSYKDYHGARFSDLMARQKQLPFGQKLQNHALNSRLNDEFHKFYPDIPQRPIIRDVATQRYWLSEQLFTPGGVNICKSVIRIIDAYVESRRDSFASFIEACKAIQVLGADANDEKLDFVKSLLAPSTDARIFEIVSFAIMKISYGDKTVWFGDTQETVLEHELRLYKTGRTNANDGGIDFVMRPLGRFFQVTETLDLKKYFLDIDKIQKFPMTFVIKSEKSTDQILAHLRGGAEQLFGVRKVVDSYMEAIEEVINIPRLLQLLTESLAAGTFPSLIQEIVVQSRIEFNLDDDEEAMAQKLEEVVTAGP